MTQTSLQTPLSGFPIHPGGNIIPSSWGKCESSFRPYLPTGPELGHLLLHSPLSPLPNMAVSGPSH